MKEIIEKLMEMASEAGKIIQSCDYDGDKADRKSDEFWQSSLKREFPDHGVITEESFHPEQMDKINLGKTWIVDPLDGTSSFKSKEESYSTMIALADKKEVILGLVHQPTTGKTYYGIKGKGAYLNGKPIRVSFIDKLEEMRLVHRHTMSNNLQPILDSISCKEKILSGSLGLKLSLIASGRCDLVVYDSQPNIWDILPGKIILEEAGGEITDIFGKEIQTTTSNSQGILATNGQIHQEILDKIQPLSYLVSKKKI